MVREGSVLSLPELRVCRMPIAQHMSAALAPVRKEGGVSLGGWVWAQGLFFTAGGGRDHIKFFITDLQKMRELHVLLSLVWVFFLLRLFTKQRQERKMQEAGESGPGTQIRREQGGRTKLLLQIGPGLCPRIPGAGPQAPEGADGAAGKTAAPVLQQPCSLGGHPGGQQVRST